MPYERCRVADEPMTSSVFSLGGTAAPSLPFWELPYIRYHICPNIMVQGHDIAVYMYVEWMHCLSEQFGSDIVCCSLQHRVISW